MRTAGPPAGPPRLALATPSCPLSESSAVNGLRFTGWFGARGCGDPEAFFGAGEQDDSAGKSLGGSDTQEDIRRARNPQMQPGQKSGVAYAS